MQKMRISKKDLIVKKSSAGLGVFSKVNIPARTRIIEYTGEKIPTSKADKRGGRYLFQINSKWAIDGSNRKNMSRYINHGCKPNCEAEVADGKVFIYSKKTIRPGDELNYNYGKEYFEVFIKGGCRCPHCTK